MLTQPQGRKIYKGQAVALGGFIQRPIPEIIQSQAAASIPISGGVDSARVEGFNHREIVSFRSARTLVSGQESPDGKNLETLATCVVEGLDILGVVTAERVVARLSGTHVALPDCYPIVTPSGSYFQGLKICGKDVTCKFICDAFDKLETGRNPAATLRTNKDLKDQIIQEDGWAAKGFLPISLCAGLHIGDQPCNPGQNVIEIPHFGRIYLGELIICSDSYRVTMLRVELGCPVEGQFDAGSVEGEPHLLP